MWFLLHCLIIWKHLSNVSGRVEKVVCTQIPADIATFMMTDQPYRDALMAEIMYADENHEMRPIIKTLHFF